MNIQIQKERKLCTTNYYPKYVILTEALNITLNIYDHFV